MITHEREPRAQDSEDEFRDVAEASLGRLARAGFAARLVTPSGTIMRQTGVPVRARARPIVDHRAIAQALSGRPLFATTSLGGASYRLLVVPFRKGAGPQALVVATSLAEAQHTARSLEVALLIAGTAGVVLAAGAAGGWHGAPCNRWRG